MPELLTHVLVAYVLATLCSWRYESITPQFATVAMAGAMIPDLSRMRLLLPAETVETSVGVPFSWAFHDVGGVALVVAIGAVLVSPPSRRRVVCLLALGAASHIVLDLFLSKPSGLSYVAFWPLTDHQFAIDGIYRSSDRWPALLAALLAAGVRLETRRRTVRRPAGVAAVDETD